MWARRLHGWSRRRDSNPEPAVYKTAALPIELRRRGAWTPKGAEAPANDRAERAARASRANWTAREEILSRIFGSRSRSVSRCIEIDDRCCVGRHLGGRGSRRARIGITLAKGLEEQDRAG